MSLRKRDRIIRHKIQFVVEIPREYEGCSLYLAPSSIPLIRMPELRCFAYVDDTLGMRERERKREREEIYSAIYTASATSGAEIFSTIFLLLFFGYGNVGNYSRVMAVKKGNKLQKQKT